MKIDLTYDELITIQSALEVHTELLRDETYCSPEPERAEELHGSAVWCWQKLEAIVQQMTAERFNNSVADAVGEGEQPTDESTASVDPFNLKGLEY